MQLNQAADHSSEHAAHHSFDYATFQVDLMTYMDRSILKMMEKKKNSEETVTTPVGSNHPVSTTAHQFSALLQVIIPYSNI